jgi:PAS domain S-box-containing protein
VGDRLHRWGLKTAVSIVWVGAVVTALGGAAMAAVITVESTESSIRFIFAKWFFSDGIGVLLMVPLVLAWASTLWDRWSIPRWPVLVEPFACLLTTLFAAQFVFGADWLPAVSVLEHPYLLAPFFIWAGLRLKARTVSLVLVLTAVVLVLNAREGYGPFVTAGQTPRELVLEIQAFLAVMAASTLILSAVVTDRKRAYAELARSEERFRLAIEAVGDGAYDYNVPTGELRVTDQWLESLGLPHQEQPLTIDFWKSLIHPEDRARALRALQEHLEGRRDRFESEYRAHKRSGGYRWNRDRGRVVSRTKGGKPLRMVGTADDVTAHKTAEERLAHTEAKMAHAARLSTMGELVAQIAHEVNQPLYSILNYSRACRNLLDREDGPDLEQLRDWNEEMGEAARRAGEVIKRLRKFGRADEFERQPTDANSIVTEVCELMRVALRKHGVRIDLKLSPDLPPVVVDRVQIQQVLVNLLQNACEAMEAAETTDRRIALRTKLLSDRVAVAVADNGPGLPDGEGWNPFDTFVTTKPDGMGLGLAISRTILEDHGGRIWATQGESGGAEFMFTLPTERSHESDIG